MSVEERVRRRPLPLDPGPLFGRDAELATVSALLADPAVRAVVITGSSGIGKTRLAMGALDVASVPNSGPGSSGRGLLLTLSSTDMNGC